MPSLRLVALLVSLLAAPSALADLPPWATGASQPEDLSVSLVTFGVSDDLVSWFGHSALVVEDRRLNHGRLYNYGMFDFAVFAKFAMGRLEFWVGEANVAGTYRAYALDNRDVRIQELNLLPAQRLSLAKALADNVLPGNREYLYHHYNDTCSTRPRDMVDRALGGQLSQGTQGPGRMTLREHTRRHSAVVPAMSVVLDFMMNDEIDRPIAVRDEAFLPAELERQLAALEYVNPEGQRVPAVAKAWVYAKATRPPVPEKVGPYEGWLLILGLAVGAIPVGLALWSRSSKRAARVLLGLYSAGLGLTLGLAGLVLFVMWMITDHTVTWRNENLFLANPLTFCSLPLGVALALGSKRAPRLLARIWVVLAASGAVGVAVKVIPFFNQDNWRLIALILPISLGTAAAFLLDARLQPAVNAVLKASNEVLRPGQV